MEVETAVVVVVDADVVVVVDDELVFDVLDVVVVVVVVLLELDAGRSKWMNMHRQFGRLTYLAGIDYTNRSDTGRYTGTRRLSHRSSLYLHTGPIQPPGPRPALQRAKVARSSALKEVF